MRKTLESRKYCQLIEDSETHRTALVEFKHRSARANGNKTDDATYDNAGREGRWHNPRATLREQLGHGYDVLCRESAASQTRNVSVFWPLGLEAKLCGVTRALLHAFRQSTGALSYNTLESGRGKAPSMRYRESAVRLMRPTQRSQTASQVRILPCVLRFALIVQAD